MPPTPPPDPSGDLVVVEPPRGFTCVGCLATDSLLSKVDDSGTSGRAVRQEASDVAFRAAFAAEILRPALPG